MRPTACSIFVVAMIFAGAAQAAPTIGVSGDLDAFAVAASTDLAGRQLLLDGGDKKQKKGIKTLDVVLATLAKPATSATYVGEMAAAVKVVRTLDARRFLDDSVRTPLAAVPPLYLADLQTARAALAALVPTLVGKPAKAAAKRLKAADKLLTKAAKYATPSQTLPLYAAAAKYLLPVPGEKEPDGLTFTTALAIDAGGQFIYVLEPGDLSQGGAYRGSVRRMRIATDGSVSDLVPKRVTAGAEPRGIAAHPSGEFLYVANNGDATISEFAIAADGGLSPLRSLPVPVSTGAPTSLVMDPAGRVLFLISYTPGAGAITSFTIASNGTLTEGHTAYAAVFTSLGSAQPTSSGSGTTYLFTAGGGDGPGVPPEVRTFAVKDDGTVDYADAFYSPASVPKVYLGPVFADPSRRVVYVARSSGSMVPFSVGDTGTIAEVPGGAASFAGSAQNMKMNPAHDRLYVAGLGPAQVWQYAVAADGSLAALSPPAVATPTPYGIEMNPGGTRVYALNGSATGAASNLVSVFDVAADGTLNAH